MLNIPFDLHYAWPKGIYSLGVIFLFSIVFYYLFHFRQKTKKIFAFENVLPTSEFLFWIRSISFCLAWLFITLAFMQPLANGHYIEGQIPQEANGRKVHFKRKAHDVLLLIDASASMAVQDSRLGKTRLESAKEIASEVLASLTGESAALYAFTSQVEQLSPLTLDSFFIRIMLNQLTINQGGTTGTNLVEAIAAMKKAFFAKPSPKLKTLIVISDGGDTFIESLEGKQQKEAIESLGNLVGNAESLQLRVYTIGVGSTKETPIPNISYNGSQVLSKLQSAPLKRLAEKGRGKYYEAENFSALSIAHSIHEQMMKDPNYYDEKSELVAGSLLQSVINDSSIIYDRYFQWPLSIGIIFLIVAIFIPQSFLRHKKEDLL